MNSLFTTTTSIIAAEEKVPLARDGIFFYVGLAIVVMLALIFWARAGLKGNVYTSFITQCAEQAYLFVENLCVSVIGSHGRKYIPFVMTLWLFIFTCNMLGLVMPHTPTADWSITVAMAVIVFTYVQYEGISQNGVFGHIKHFAGPKLLGIMALTITPLVFGIELLSEVIKVLSLSVRLYGNIYAGHQAKETMDGLVHQFPVLGSLFLTTLEFLVAIIQAFVFVLLTCVYLSLVTHEHEHEEEYGAIEEVQHEHAHAIAHA